MGVFLTLASSNSSGSGGDGEEGILIVSFEALLEVDCTALSLERWVLVFKVIFRSVGFGAFFYWIAGLALTVDFLFQAGISVVGIALKLLKRKANKYMVVKLLNNSWLIWEGESF
jgi:hypothetical protein